MHEPSYPERVTCSFQELVEETRRQVNADRVLITEVTNDSQYVLAVAGPPLPSHLSLVMPLSHSICQHAIGMRFPLKIEDTRAHPLLAGSYPFQDLDIGAYLGQPFGERFPALVMCALSQKSRKWEGKDHQALNRTVAAILEHHSDELGELVQTLRSLAQSVTPNNS